LVGAVVAEREPGPVDLRPAGNVYGLAVDQFFDRLLGDGVEALAVDFQALEAGFAEYLADLRFGEWR
jgi:hypothetical protein